MPVSWEKGTSSPDQINAFLKIHGLITINIIARIIEGTKMLLITDKFKFAPKAKKNRTKKKSRSGLNRSAINKAIL